MQTLPLSFPTLRCQELQVEVIVIDRLCYSEIFLVRGSSNCVGIAQQKGGLALL